MLKRNITYEDFNGDTVTDVYYFNLTKSELMELELSYDAGFGTTMQRIIEAKDHKTLIEEFKKIILLSYGVKSDDGKRFIKSDQLREEFTQTAAFNALFMELATDTAAAANFINGVVPKDMSQALEKLDVPNQNEKVTGMISAPPFAPPK